MAEKMQGGGGENKKETSFSIAAKIEKKEHTLPRLRFGHVKYKGENLDSIDDFVDVFAPSKISSKEFAWICVDSPTRSTKNDDDDDDDDDEHIIDPRSTRMTVNSVIQYATQKKKLGGKWLVYPRSVTNADELWRVIATGVRNGELGHSAKVSPLIDAARSDFGVICVYVQNFLDVDDVAKMWKRLKEIGVTQPITFKPDVFTSLGIYCQNPWNIKPSWSPEDVSKHVMCFMKSSSSSSSSSSSTTSSTEPLNLPDNFSCVTYNVYFGEEHMESRSEKLFALLADQLQPDIVCLQEVTIPFLRLLYNHAKMMEIYKFITPFASDSYGTITLSKIRPWKWGRVRLPSKMDRDLLVCAYAVKVADETLSLCVGNVHLESLNNPDVRKKQLGICARFFSNMKNVLLIGDFNFDDKRSWGDWDKPQVDETTLENNVLKAVLGVEYVDCGEGGRGGRDGFTFDGKKNRMVKNRRERARYDRVMMKQTNLALESYKLIGTDPFSVKWDDLWISDHFGIFTTFKTLPAATSK